MDAAWLRKTLKSHKITQRELGDAIGLTQDKINKTLSHVRLFNPLEAIRVADFLEAHGVAKSETLRSILGKEAALIEGRGVFGESKSTFHALQSGSNNTSSAPHATVPIVGYTGVGGQIFPYTAKDQHTETTSLELDTSITNVCGVRVNGNSLYPLYHDGDIVFFSENTPLEAGLNKECVACLDDGRMFLKVLKRGSLPNAYTLDSFNTPPIDNVRLEWASKVLWVKRG